MAKLLEPAAAWAWGIGWDSSAAIVEHIRRGQPIALISAADHGAENREPDRENGEEVGTYEFFDIFSNYVESKGYPRPVRCRYQPKAVTDERYLAAVLKMIRELDLADDIPAERQLELAGIFGNAIANLTLPGLAFGVKSCSVKWKLEAQEPI